MTQYRKSPKMLYDGSRIEAYQLPTGDWIIKNIAGEFYSCKSDVFDNTYELA